MMRSRPSWVFCVKAKVYLPSATFDPSWHHMLASNKLCFALGFAPDGATEHRGLCCARTLRRRMERMTTALELKSFLA